MHLENRAYIVDALAMFDTCTDLHRKTYTGRKKLMLKRENQNKIKTYHAKINYRDKNYDETSISGKNYGG